MRQLVDPDLGTLDYSGACLRFTQSVFGAPARNRSATLAANETQHRHHTRDMPDAAVPVWFSHVGEYNDGRGQYGDDPNRPYLGDWGHVVTWVPGRGFLSSPGYGNTVSQQWFGSIEEIQQVFAGSFLFWSEDINGLRVCEPSPEAREEDEDMPYLIVTDNGDQLVVDHAQMTFWNVHEGVPAGLVEARKNWLLAQGAVKPVQGVQPAALLSGYRWVHAPITGTAPAGATITDGDVERIAEAVNNEAAERLKK